GTAGVITNGRNLYDLFGVLRYEQGSAQTPWRWKRGGDDGIVFVGERGYLINAAVFTSSPFDDIVRRLICEWACERILPHGPDYLRRACVDLCLADGKNLRRHHHQYLHRSRPARRQSAKREGVKPMSQQT
ncbi:MAG: hypothetical protein ACUVTY_15170, partial [Armatimonadota bacterium]